MSDEGNIPSHEPAARGAEPRTRLRGVGLQLIAEIALISACRAGVANSTDVARKPPGASVPPIASAAATLADSSADGKGEGDDLSVDVPPEDMVSIGQLVKALQADDRVAVSRLIRYPLRRSEPLDPIGSADEFIGNYDDFFDSKTIPQVIEACKSASPWHSWRGTNVGNGVVWIEGGKIVVFNLVTDKQHAEAARARQWQSLKLAPSLRNYTSVLLDCITKHHHIRIHDEGGTVRYVAWSAGVPPSSEPDLSLKGTYEWEGSGGARRFMFKKGTYIYDVYAPRICSGENNDCEPTVTVTQAGRQLSSEVCSDSSDLSSHGSP